MKSNSKIYIGEKGRAMKERIKKKKKKYILLVLRIWRFKNTLMKQDTFLFGTLLTQFIDRTSHWYKLELMNLFT